MSEKVYNKLVRDKIPEIIAASGKKCITHIADTDEYRDFLFKKVAEEIEEFKETPNAEEAADIMEIVKAIFAEYGIDEGVIEDTRVNKYAKRGGFKDRIILEKVVEE